MENHGGTLHVSNATRWNSQLRCVSSYLQLDRNIVEELAVTIPSISAKVVDHAGRKALEDLVEVMETGTALDSVYVQSTMCKCTESYDLRVFD